MNKLSMLLSRRPALLRQTRLANLAFAFATLDGFVQRIARAQIRGRVNVKHAAPDADRYWASLTAPERWRKNREGTPEGRQCEGHPNRVYLTFRYTQSGDSTGK